jgi:hypothetical protein
MHRNPIHTTQNALFSGIKYGVPLKVGLTKCGFLAVVNYQKNEKDNYLLLD